MTLNLKLPAAFNCQFHFEFALLLLFEQSVGFVFGFLDLLVENMGFVVLDRTELCNLFVDHTLTFVLFIYKPLVFPFLFHQVSCALFLSEGFNFLLFCEFTRFGFFLVAHLLLVGCN